MATESDSLTDHNLEGLWMIFQAVQDIARNGTVIGRAQVLKATDNPLLGIGGEAGVNILSPKPGDCCNFCSCLSVRSPLMQGENCIFCTAE